MRGGERARRGSLALAVIALLVAGSAVAAAASPAPPSPSPAAPRPSSSAPARVSVRLGSLSVNLDVPLNLGNVLVVGDAGSSTASSTAPPISSAPPSSAPANRPSSGPTHTATPDARPGASSAPRAHGGFEAPAPGAPSRTRGTTSGSAAPTTSHQHVSGGLVLTRRLFSDDGAILLALILVALTLAVAVFVKLSGRRGGHQA